MNIIKKLSWSIAVALCTGTVASQGSYARPVTSMVLTNPFSQTFAEPPSGYAPQASTPSVYPEQTNLQLAPAQPRFVREDNIDGEQLYIVELDDAPAAVYDGAIAGVAATSTQVKQQLQHSTRPLNTQQPQLAQYRDYLSTQRQQVLDAAANLHGVQVQVDRSFYMVFNGFTAHLTQDDAEKLAQLPGVKQVRRSTLRQLSTYQSGQQSGAHTQWVQSQTSRGSSMGEGMVIGIMDTGINTDHPSFAAVGGDGYRHKNPLGNRFLGDCVQHSQLCNDKLIGVYSYPEITAAYQDPVFTQHRPAYGEDYHSHGSHVAGTAAGNILRQQPYVIADFKAQSDGIDTGVRLAQVSGMAPHANIIAYQVCFPGNTGDPYAGCPTSAILAAVEQSVLDNVDVINLSLGGQEENPWTDPMEQAFYHAAKAGVMVVTAAGNQGDRLYTADHSSPWVTSVAAHTPAQRFISKEKALTDLQGGDSAPPAAIAGVSTTFTEVSGRIVQAKDYVADPTASDAADCDAPFAAGTFVPADDPATADVDEAQWPVLVVCQRSQKPLYAKSLHVQQGGAAGIIITNQSEDADYGRIPDIPHAIPGIHIRYSDAKVLRQWLASGSGHRARITATPIEQVAAGSEKIAGFSSRGPSNFQLNTMVVDIAAPGVDIYAPAADDQPFTAQPSASDWTLMSGTSMASPHVAGAAVLLRQSHPHWTPMQVQSALLMTASDALDTGSVFDPYTSNDQAAQFQDMGAGRMNVDLADRVDLTLNEDLNLMSSADPAQGGKLARLNTAYMVNNRCGNQCSFVRTFTAERAGTWSLSVDATDVNTDISVEPMQFSLAAGEQQAVLVTVRYKGAASATPAEQAAGQQANLQVKPHNSAASALALPIWTWRGERGMPQHTLIEAHRSSGTLLVGPFATAEVSNLTARSYGLVKATSATGHVWSDTTPHDLFDGDSRQPSTLLTWHQVPANSQAFMTRVSGKDTHRLLLFVGFDRNQDGQAQQDELVCMSTSTVETNYCALQQPNAGRYWSVVMSVADVPFGQPDAGRDITLSSAVIAASDNQQLKIQGGQAFTGYQPYQLPLSYQVKTLQQGDVYFGGYDLGTDSASAGNLGFVPVTLLRGIDDVTLTASKTAAKPGDKVDYLLSVIANTDAQEKPFSFSAVLPAGLKLIPESVKASHATPGKVSTSNNSVQLTGVQVSSRDVQRNYRVTNSDNDAMCSLALLQSPQQGYLDLRALGWRTLPDVSGNFATPTEYNLQQLMASDEPIYFPYFGNRRYDRIGINPAGVLQFGSRPLPDLHLKLPEALSWVPLPEDMIAPLWVGDQQVARFDAPYDQQAQNAGVTATYTVDRQWLVLEYDNITRREAPQHLVDFEVFLRMQINHEPGQYEMLFAYDNLNLPSNDGSIGFKQADGFVIVDGDVPVEISQGQGIAYNDVGHVVHNKLVMCMDYQGPEQSKFDIRFSAYVSEQAAATTATVELTNGLQGSDNEVIRLPLTVAGNLQLLPLANASVDENQSYSFAVRYLDDNAVSNIISVSGAHVTAKVNGHTSGSIVTLTPDANFHGTSRIKVQVSDSVNKQDQAVAEFTLTVKSDGIELGCTDKAATNFAANANRDDGSCQYPPGQTASGGAIPLLLSSMLLLVGWQRRRN